MAEGQSPSVSSFNSLRRKEPLSTGKIVLNGRLNTLPSLDYSCGVDSTQSKVNGSIVANGNSAADRSDLLSTASGRVSVIAKARPMLGVSLNSDLVSSTSTDGPSPPGSSLSPTSSVMLKPPRIMPLVSPTTPTTDAARLQPVATQSYSPCYLVDVEVRLKPGYADILLKDRVGVVRKVEGKTAMVHIKENPSYITIPHESLVPVKPHVLDTVKVIGGNSTLVGLIGTLVSFTRIDGEGLVQFLSWSNQRPRNPAQISLLHLGRYSPLSKFGSNSGHSGSSSSSSRSVSGSSPGTMPSAPRILPGNQGGFKLVSTSSSLSKSGCKSSSSFPMSGLPLSFITPPPSSPAPPAKSKSAAPAHIVALPSNLSSRPAVVMREVVAPPILPVTYSALSYGHKKTLQGNSSSMPGGESTSNGVIRGAKLVHLPGIPGGVGGAAFPSIGGVPFSMFVEKDTPRKENILLSKIAAMNRNGFFPVSRGGGGELEDVDMAEVLERLVRQQRDYLYELTTPTTPGGGNNLDVKASCVRVSLVCPLGQQRMKYPSRGRSCKHLQCFDAENYISFHKKLIRRNRLKQSRGSHCKSSPLDKCWNCPICEKMAHLQHLYIDRALMKLVQETSATEVELRDDGTWAPVEKTTGSEVIDLTGDD